METHETCFIIERIIENPNEGIPLELLTPNKNSKYEMD